MKKIILDTDPGCDDALAIVLAVKSKKLKIAAITTVAGNSTVENTTRNARYILELLKEKNIPIYSGATKPLKQDLVQAVVHDKSGLTEIRPENEEQLTNNAPEKIISLIADSPQKITLVAIGPLTNIAMAIKKNPQVMLKIKRIIIMGGALRVPGNKSRVAEFNFFVDPEAAKIVFDFPVKKILVPLDICNKIRLSVRDFKQIENKILREKLLKMIIPFSQNTRKNEGFTGIMMYDVLAVFSLLKPNFIKTKDYDIKIETKGKLTRGVSVPDLRTEGIKENNVTVIEQVDKREFRNYFINTLSK